MASDGKTTRPERDETDKSLRVERANVDRSLARRETAAALDAEKVVRRARKTADAVLVEARDKADEAQDQDSPGPEERDTVTQERALEDAALEVERSSADEGLQRDRDDDARALSKLLPLEREKTDKYLLTERARSDEDLSHRDDFLSIVCHDLRNLLGGMVVSATLLADRAGEGENGKQTIAEAARIHRYAARMNRLIGDLVDVASIEAGRLAVIPARGDVTALISEAVELFHAIASTKGVALTMDAADGPLMASFDHDRMIQVLANLISNAIKFTPSGGTVRIRSERRGDQLRLTVTDTGPGIPDTMLEAIFERFWQRGKNDPRGLGLGLFISRGIIDAHGGKIWAESEPGRGTSLHVTLPA